MKLKKYHKFLVAADGSAASGKTTGAKKIARKFGLKFLSSGLLYRYASNQIIKNKPKNIVRFLNNRFKKITYKFISKQNLHSEQISNHVASLAKNRKVREIVNKFQKKIIKKNNKICVEGRDIASKILAKNPKYDLAFYFKCNVNIASVRRWQDIRKKIPLKEVKRSLLKRTLMDKTRKNSPLIKVKDAILVRSDQLNKQQVLNKMSKAIDRALRN